MNSNRTVLPFVVSKNLLGSGKDDVSWSSAAFQLGSQLSKPGIDLEARFG